MEAQKMFAKITRKHHCHSLGYRHDLRIVSIFYAFAIYNVVHNYKSSYSHLTSMPSFNVGDKVLAARKQQHSEMLSPACHEAKIICFTKVNHRGKELVTLEYAKDLGTNYLKIDTIKYVPSGTKGAAAHGRT